VYPQATRVPFDRLPCGYEEQHAGSGSLKEEMEAEIDENAYAMFGMERFHAMHLW
jgi:hypothetical protein